MNIDLKKFAFNFLIPALIIYAAVVIMPPIITPYLGPAVGTWASGVAAVFAIIAGLWFYRRFIAKRGKE